MYLPGPRLRRDGVDREIPTREIVHEVIPERHLRVPATLSVEVAPVRRDLYVVSTDLGSDSPEALTHHPQVVRHWPQKLLDLLWSRLHHCQGSPKAHPARNRQPSTVRAPPL